MEAEAAEKKSNGLADLIQKGRQQYRSMSARDRLALQVMGAFFAVMIIVYGILLPSAQRGDTADNYYRERMALLQWMKANEQQARAVSGASKSSSIKGKGQSVLSVANNTAKKYKLTFKRFEPEGENGVRLRLEQVAFNDLVLWLDVLKKDYAVLAKQVTVERQDAPGLVNVKLLLKR